MKKYQKELQNAKPLNSTHKNPMSLYMSGDFGMAFTVGLFLVLFTGVLLLPFGFIYHKNLNNRF